jgi:Flp pilus assembly CpaF family ATPase
MSFEVILPFLGPITELLESAMVSEIMVNPDSSIWFEEEGSVRSLPGRRFEDGALEAGLEVIANRFGKKLDADSPLLNLRLPDGSRLAAMIPPVVHPGPLLTIRKFISRSFTLADLIRFRMLTEAEAGILTGAVRAGRNILIAGSTGSGKSTLLGVLSDAIPDEERILVIEDTAELHIRKPHLISTESQTDTHRRNVTFDDLLKAALRHRPDRIIVGEVRGLEARTFLDALNTGHRGSISTIHANSASDSLRRLAQLALRGSGGGVPMRDVEDECARSIHLAVHVVKEGGWRHVAEIRRTME